MSTTPSFAKVRPATHLFLVLCILLCGGSIFWAYTGKLDIVSVAIGKVAPSGRVKSVQHLEGGIVSAIMVREGDSVKAGQPLFEMESTQSDLTVEEAELRMYSLKADVARLTAEAEGLDEPVFPDNLEDTSPRMVQDARMLFEESRKRLNSEIAVRGQAVREREQVVREISARIRNNRKQLKLVDEQVAISEELLKDNLTTRYKHLSFLNEQTAIRSRIEEDGAAIAGARARLAEAKEELSRVQLVFRENAREELRSAQQQLEEVRKKLGRHRESQSRMIVRSPVDGVVKHLKIVTVGGVVRPGEVIADVVPDGDRLIVEAHLPISDIGYVHPGQDAFIKLASRDSSRFGRIEGKVQRISPDAFTTQEGQTFYQVRIETDRDRFEQDGREYKLYPGIQVVAYIRTGERTVLEYLLDPMLSSMSLTMSER